MRRIALVLAACAAWLALPAPLYAQRNRDEDQIRNWYRDYLGREVGPEIKAWAELLRGGMSSLDVQATILGSDEFYNQKGRDVQSFLTETLQSVNWQEPTVSELRRWTDRLTALRGDRFAVAREILLASDQPHSGTSPAGPAASEVAGRLASAAKLLIDTIDFEIGGTPQGRQANLKAQALLDAAEQFRRSAGGTSIGATSIGATSTSLTSVRPSDPNLALQNVQRSLTALQSTLNNPAGTAPSSAGIARRLSTIIDEAGQSIRSTSTTPLPGSNLGGTPQSLLDQTAAASRAVESLIQAFSGQGAANYNSGVILRDLDTFAARLDELQTSIRRNASRERLQWEIEALTDQAARLEPQLLAGRPPSFTRLYWSSVTSSLEQMGETLGVPASGSTAVLRPTPVAPEILPLVDQALSRSDVYLTGTQPLVFGVAEVPRVQRDVRNLKTRLLTLRQQAQDGEPATTQLDTLNSMVADYQSAYSRWGQIVTAYKLQNPPRLSPVGETLNEVERLLKQAVNFDDLTPTTGSVGSSRVARLLESLSQEQRLFRDQLPAFVNYPEHQALLTYCDQVEGYLASLDSLQRNPTAAPDSQRRQAAGLQRVVELLNATAETVQSRLLATGARAPNEGTRLVTQARRLANLTDDLESQLH